MHETVNLSDPSCPLSIDYSKEAMEQIRRRARAGLMAAPRVGMAVGGLLLGVRDGSRIRILDSVELPCSHSTGPSFTLTPQEKRESIEMVAEANALSATSKVSVIGWYCSKTRGDAVLSEADQAFFSDLFPGEGQLALVLRPDVFESMRAVFFYRGRGGVVLKGVECEVDEWKPPLPTDPESYPAGVSSDTEPPAVEPASETRQPVARPEPAVLASATMAPASPAPVPAGPVSAKPAVKSSGKPAGETRLEDIIGLSAAESPVRAPAAPAYLSPALGAPNFAVKPGGSGRIWLALLAAAVVIVLSAVAFFTRDTWYPRPPLSLTFTELDGSLLIHWDPDSVRGIRKASMYVNDGGQTTPSVIPLDRFQLSSGQLSYTPKSTHITAKLDAGDVSAFETWTAPEPKQSDKPPATTPESTDPVQAAPAPGRK